jgi:hypothetical protein
MIELFRGRSLKSIFINHSGKVCDKWSSYLEIYEREFSKYRATTSTIVEIGVQNCGSLEIWAKYFRKSKSILGVDILDQIRELKFEDNRIKTLACNARELHENYCEKFKSSIIIIDDASHQSHDIISTFLTMFPLLKNGGTYVVEDLCCSYWLEFNSGSTISSMEFFKILADVINAEHWNQGGEQSYTLPSSRPWPFNKLGNLTNEIMSLKFYNSMCFIEKINTKKDNQIGSRFVVGNDAPLNIRAESGQTIHDLQRTTRNFNFDDSDLDGKV